MKDTDSFEVEEVIRITNRQLEILIKLNRASFQQKKLEFLASRLSKIYIYLKKGDMGCHLSFVMMVNVEVF